jgi:hypothetical protein
MSKGGAILVTAWVAVNHEMGLLAIWCAEPGAA